MQVHNYKKYFQDIVDLQIPENSKVISAVFPLPDKGYDFEQVSAEYKSFINEEFKKRGFNKNDFLEQDLNLAIQETEKNIDLNKKGHFSLIVFSEKGSKGEKFVDNHFSFPLWIKPVKKTVYIGNHPKPVHLYQNMYYDEEKLVLILHKDSADLYGYRQNYVKKIDSIETSFVDDYAAKEYLEEHRNPGKIDHIQGSGEDKNQDLEVSRAFFREELLPFLKTHTSPSHKEILILHQDNGVINTLKDYLQEEIEKNSLKVKFLEKFAQDLESVKEIVEKIVFESIQKDEKDFLSEMKENPTKFEADFLKIVEAVQLGKIDTLYVDYDLSGEQFNIDDFNKILVDKNNVLDSQEEAYNWLFYKVFEQGGAVYPSVLTSNKDKFVARLRF